MPAVVVCVLRVTCYATWPVMVSYLPPIPSLDIQLIFVLMADDIKFVLGFFLYSFSHIHPISSDNSEHNLSLV
jgi:hypothetical protein